MQSTALGVGVTARNYFLVKVLSLQDIMSSLGNRHQSNNSIIIF